MSPKLKPLLLPLLVEERRKRESILDTTVVEERRKRSTSDTDMDLSSSFSQTSTPSEIPSPVTPTFSGRGHLRYPSSTSSIESTFHASTSDSPQSPTFAAKASKRSLPDVQEEPHERDEDTYMFDDDDVNDLYNCDNLQCLHREPSMAAQSSEQLSIQQTFDYDMADGFFSDGEYALSTRHKKRRANETPLNGLADRIGNRFPSFSRKWRLRKGRSSSNSIVSEWQGEKTASRAASSRSSSISTAPRPGPEKALEGQMPPTPTASIFDNREDCSPAIPIDIDKANNDSTEPDENFATTPLLPPLMTDLLAHLKDIPIQSPLQSPSVAGVNDQWGSGNVTPIDTIITPQVAGIPSPPLSNKPSVSSFRRSTTSRPSHLIPSSDIPPIHIADANDEWSIKLGHANFSIHPDPYIPDVFDLEACRQLRANWDLARCNYTKHLVRTGEHYGVTSKAYKLTEEKWSSIDATWRKNNDITIGHTVENGNDAFSTLQHTTLGDDSTNNVMTRIPSLNDPRCEGKFPQMGDEDIVGPMVQVAAQLQKSPGKKAKIIKFFAGKFPVGLGRT